MSDSEHSLAKWALTLGCALVVGFAAEVVVAVAGLALGATVGAWLIVPGVVGFAGVGAIAWRGTDRAAMRIATTVLACVVVVSACYSGGFLPALRGDTTLSFSAARADRTSFGCGSDRDFTYFGEALLRDQLAKGADILPAIEGARVAVAARERQEKLTPSEPQMLLGDGIKAQLYRLSLQEKNIAGITAAGIPAARIPAARIPAARIR